MRQNTCMNFRDSARARAALAWTEAVTKILLFNSLQSDVRNTLSDNP